MGRYYWDKKRTVQECKSVSIPFLRKEGFLCGYCSGAIVWTDRFGEETASMSVVASSGYGVVIFVSYTR